MDWKRKLTSRKFWAAVTGFVTALLAAFGVPEMTTQQVTALIAALAPLIAYIIGEGLADCSFAATATSWLAPTGDQESSRNTDFEKEEPNEKGH